MAAPAATEIRFARRLADNDKAVRDKAVKKLRTWLHKQHGLSELDNCKLWRGLFFCMWMSDKPLVQEELADQIARLIHLLPGPEQSLAFARAFFVIMGREWTSIDRHRIDKFYLLVRKCLAQLFEFLKRNEWSAELAGQVGTILTDVPLAATGKYPNGLKWFIIEKFVPELSSVSAESPCPEATLTALLEPFMHTIAWDSAKITRQKVHESVFGVLLQSEHSLAAPWTDLAARCFALAADKALSPQNRTCLYSLRKEFLAAEAESSSDEPSESSTPESAPAPPKAQTPPKAKQTPIAAVLDEAVNSTPKGKKEKTTRTPKEKPAPTPKGKLAPTPKDKPARTPKEKSASAPRENSADTPKEKTASTPKQKATGAPEQRTPEEQTMRPAVAALPTKQSSGKKRFKDAEHSGSPGKKAKLQSTPEAGKRATAMPATEAKAAPAPAAQNVPQTEPPKKPRVQIVLSNNKISQFNKFHRVARPDSPRAFDPNRKPASSVLRRTPSGSASTPLHTARVAKT